MDSDDENKKKQREGRVGQRRKWEKNQFTSPSHHWDLITNVKRGTFVNVKAWF